MKEDGGWDISGHLGDLRIYLWRFSKKCKSVGVNLHVNSISNSTVTTIIADNVVLNGITIGGLGNVYIGNNCRIGRDCLIITSNHNYNKPDRLPYDDKLISKDVIINNNV